MATTIFLVNPQTFPSSTSYLLDTYSAAAAYSLRQLKTGVTSVVRVRRSSDFAESDFSATDITDGTLVAWTGANNGFVTTLYDQSGNGIDLTQSAAGNQPRLVSAGTLDTKGGLPCVKFISTDRLIYAAGVMNQTSLSTFCVSSADTATAVYGLFSASDTTVNTYNVILDARTTPNRNLILTNTGGTSYFGDLSTSYNDTNQRLLSSFVDASKNLSSFDNGNTGGTDTYTGSFTSDGLTLGARGDVSLPLVGTVQEVILFNTDESANRTAIESDINTHYSIY